jgi:hypothetical protein
MGRRDIIITGLFSLLAIGGTSLVSGLTMAENIYTPYVLNAGWIAIGLGLSGLVYLFRTAPKVAFAAAQEAVSGPPPREFLPPEITWTVLGAKIEGRTSIQIEAITKTYVGKWMRVSGRVMDVVSISKGFCVHVREDGVGAPRSVSGYFDDTESDRMLSLNKGEWISFVGKVARLQYGGSMEGCEIEHVGEPPKPKVAPKPRTPRKRTTAKPSAS